MRKIFWIALILLILISFSTSVMAKEEEKKEKSDLAMGLLAFAAALSVGMTAIATGIAQSKIGAAGTGAVAEKPELAGTVIILVAIPETMVILGFVVAAIIIYGL
jgi:V/A-type H+-transporting ATPase subunit K